MSASDWSELLFKLVYNPYSPDEALPLAICGPTRLYCDPESVEPYFVSVVSKESSWAKPADWNDDLAVVCPLAILRGVPEAVQAQPLGLSPRAALPVRTWVVYKDPQWWLQFFVNAATGELQWLPPPEISHLVLEGPGAGVAWTKEQEPPSLVDDADDGATGIDESGGQQHTADPHDPPRLMSRANQRRSSLGDASTMLVKARLAAMATAQGQGTDTGAHAIGQALVGDWMVLHDNSTGALYYAHATEGRVQWEVPVELLQAEPEEWQPIPIASRSRASTGSEQEATTPSPTASSVIHTPIALPMAMQSQALTESPATPTEQMSSTTAAHHEVQVTEKAQTGAGGVTSLVPQPDAGDVSPSSPPSTGPASSPSAFHAVGQDGSGGADVPEATQQQPSADKVEPAKGSPEQTSTAAASPTKGPPLPFLARSPSCGHGVAHVPPRPTTVKPSARNIQAATDTTEQPTVEGLMNRIFASDPSSAAAVNGLYSDYYGGIGLGLGNASRIVRTRNYGQDKQDKAPEPSAGQDSSVQADVPPAAPPALSIPDVSPVAPSDTEPAASAEDQATGQTAEQALASFAQAAGLGQDEARAAIKAQPGGHMGWANRRVSELAARIASLEGEVAALDEKAKDTVDTKAREEAQARRAAIMAELAAKRSQAENLRAWIIEQKRRAAAEARASTDAALASVLAAQAADLEAKRREIAAQKARAGKAKAKAEAIAEAKRASAAAAKAQLSQAESAAAKQVEAEAAAKKSNVSERRGSTTGGLIDRSVTPVARKPFAAAEAVPDSIARLVGAGAGGGAAAAAAGASKARRGSLIGSTPS